jgi:hypothetical protein
MSRDDFIAGPNDSAAQPLGPGGQFGADSDILLHPIRSDPRWTWPASASRSVESPAT